MIIAARVRELKLNLEDCRIKVNLDYLPSMHTLGSIPHHTQKYFFKNATGLEKANQNKGIGNNPPKRLYRRR